MFAVSSLLTKNSFPWPWHFVHNCKLFHQNWWMDDAKAPTVNLNGHNDAINFFLKWELFDDNKEILFLFEANGYWVWKAISL